ncbi:hypothetical protein ETD83_13045 [Actinomadura soli]|uniref:Uncharacterized protein n=1 Tax=Actinomadura soli TaxID=2508997 RepID=A0A5C4JFU9_9ACTN|nr:hypothetical protein [Actinomadura soli]TMR02217.1 hypothetical protein ETD83_13045 [Actinomadura soli]
MLTENGMEFMPDHPVEGFAHEPYTVARYYRGPDFGRSILRVLRKAFDAQLAAGRITLSLKTRLTGHTVPGCSNQDHGPGASGSAGSLAGSRVT